MLRVYSCITTQHDLRLVALAALVCVLASFTAVTLIHHVQHGRAAERRFWLAVAAVATGFGIWTTHFIAMLAFQPDLPSGYDPTLTVLSLVAAVGLTGLGFAIAFLRQARLAGLVGGAVVGGGIATMHYTGMAGFETIGRIAWDVPLVVASIVLGSLLAAAALSTVLRADTTRTRTLGTLLLTLAICVHHFTAMAAASIVPDPRVAAPEVALPPGVLAVGVAFMSLVIIGLAFAVLAVERRQHRIAGESARMRELADAAIEGIVVCDEDRIVTANRSFIALACTGDEEIGQRSLASFFPAIMPDELAHATLKPIEATLRAMDGRTVPVELIHRRFTYMGKPHQVFAVRDITQRKQDEAALAAQSRLLRSTLDSIPQGVAVYDSALRLAACNDAFPALLGLPENLVEVGTPLADVIRAEAARGENRHGDPEALVLDAFELFGGSASMVHDRDLSDGRTIEVRANPMPDGGFVATYTDISERKRVERLKSEFVSTVSHELRTPLASMVGSLGLILGGAGGEVSPSARPLLDIAHNNGNRLQRLINDILDIEKIEAGKMEFELRHLALPLLVEQATEANRAYVEGRGAKLALAAPLPNVILEGDLDRLLQVMANLLSNAAKFSPPGAAVTIGAEQSGDRVRIRVTDRGPGIAEDFRDRIFGKFAQADSSDARQKGGTGLGLSISKAIVEHHRGEIGFETELGTGTTFYVDLPIAKPAAEPASRTEAPRPCILICEKDPEAAELIRAEIAKAGLKGEIARSAAEARARLAEGDYVALTLDLTLSEKGGLGLLHDLRADPRTRDVPIIAVSAASDADEQSLRSETIGIVDWLIAPIDPWALRRAVARVAGAVDARPHVLHVEDDLDIQQVVAVALRDVAAVEAVGSVAAAMQRLEHSQFDLVLLDIALPDGVGTDLLPVLDRREGPPVPIVIFSAFDVPREVTRQVAASLVKSRTSTERLRATVGGLIGRILPMAEPIAEAS